MSDIYQQEDSNWMYHPSDGGSKPFVSYIQDSINQDQNTSYSVLKDQNDHNTFYVVDLEKTAQKQCLFIEFVIKIVDNRSSERKTLAFFDINNPDLAGLLLSRLISSSIKSDHVTVSLDTRETLRRLHSASDL